MLIFFRQRCIFGFDRRPAGQVAVDGSGEVEERRRQDDDALRFLGQGDDRSPVIGHDGIGPGRAAALASVVLGRTARKQDQTKSDDEQTNFFHRKGTS